jgi:hypothetical protein
VVDNGQIAIAKALAGFPARANSQPIVHSIQDAKARAVLDSGESPISTETKVVIAVKSRMDRITSINRVEDTRI